MRASGQSRSRTRRHALGQAGARRSVEPSCAQSFDGPVEADQSRRVRVGSFYVNASVLVGMVAPAARVPSRGAAGGGREGRARWARRPCARQRVDGVEGGREGVGVAEACGQAEDRAPRAAHDAGRTQKRIRRSEVLLVLPAGAADAPGRYRSWDVASLDCARTAPRGATCRGVPARATRPRTPAATRRSGS